MGHPRFDRQGKTAANSPVPSWSKQLLDAWLLHSGVSQGRVFRKVSKKGKRQEAGVTANVEPEDFIVGMTVKTKSIGPDAD